MISQFNLLVSKAGSKNEVLNRLCSIFAIFVNFFFKEFRHNIVKLCLRIHSYFENVMTKFMISNGTDGWKTDVKLLNNAPITSTVLNAFDTWVRFFGFLVSLFLLIISERKVEPVVVMATMQCDVWSGKQNTYPSML